MESLEERIEAFLSRSYGSGDGSGDGDGYGYGSGSGDGSGSGVKSYNRQTVHMIDGVATIITSVVGNIAKGYILRAMELRRCYIAKCGDYFAHGETREAAMADAQRKYDDNKPEEERIADFIRDFPTLDSVVPCSRLFVCHNRLTGSCEMGRREFCRRHGINVESDSMTVAEFINITKNEYGGDTIRRLEQEYQSIKNKES